MELKQKSVAWTLAFAISGFAGLVGAVDNLAVIQGLGMRNPNSPDVSKSKDFHVYELHKDGVTYVQLNKLTGEVLTAIAMTGNGQYYVIPVGSLGAAAVVLPRNQAEARLVQPMNGGIGQCPCSGQVVYSGPDGTVIVVHDAQGNVLQVVVLQKQQPPMQA